MLKKQISKWVMAALLLVAVTAGVRIVADRLGLPVMLSAYACPAGGGGDGGC